MPETIFTSPADFALAALILFCAQVVYVVFGFGAGLIAVGSLALLFPDIKDVVVLLLLVSAPAEVFIVARSWRFIRWRGILGLWCGILPGIPLGAYFLKYGEPTFILVLLGGVLVAVGTVFLRLPRARSFDWPLWSAPPVGLSSGVLTGLFGTGGPPLIVYFHLGGADKAVFRGNLMAIFLAMTFVRLPAYTLAGLITAPRLWSGLLILPIILCGAWVGSRIHLRLSESVFRTLVSGLLILIGVLLLLRRFVF